MAIVTLYALKELWGRVAGLMANPGLLNLSQVFTKPNKQSPSLTRIKDEPTVRAIPHSDVCRVRHTDKRGFYAMMYGASTAKSGYDDFVKMYCNQPGGEVDGKGNWRVSCERFPVVVHPRVHGLSVKGE